MFIKMPTVIFNQVSISYDVEEKHDFSSPFQSRFENMENRYIASFFLGTKM